MLKLVKAKRAVALGAVTLALVGGATIGLGGTANASVGAPNPDVMRSPALRVNRTSHDHKNPRLRPLVPGAL